MASSAIASAPRPVTDEEVLHYREHGWVKLSSFISSDLAAELLARAQERIGTEPDAENSDRANQSVRDGGWWQSYFFIARDDKVEPFRSLVFSPEIAANAQRLIGRDIPVRYYGDELAVKMPQGRSGDAATKWHQDLPHNSFDRVGHHAFWIALDDVPAERGSLRFISGSHREGSLGRVQHQGKDVLEYYPELLDRHEMSPPLDLKAGDATAHHALTVHSASQNMTDSPRWAYILAYFPADTLYNGAAHSATSNEDRKPSASVLEVGKPFDHPDWPIVG